MNKSKLIISSAYAASVSIAFAVIITIWAEFFAPLKGWLAAFSGHHWVSKSIFAMLVYVVVMIVFFIFPQKNSDTGLKRGLGVLFTFTILGTVALTLFFTGHHFHVF